ncbi:MAG TPA: nucleotidyl transferase AbiEii/AbiGii toxin family protein [Mycobacterium sp.]|nr:nucleotidyl transferase AbiEii/AbiGii toxin family protein [Mycobacterium sp.]
MSCATSWSISRHRASARSTISSTRSLCSSLLGCDAPSWADRLAPRDLWDLWALSELGAIGADAAALYRRYGPTRKAPGLYLFNRAPSDAEWQTQLAGQTRLSVSATEALNKVRQAWRHAVRPARTLINDE